MIDNEDLLDFADGLELQSELLRKRGEDGPAGGVGEIRSGGGGLRASGNDGVDMRGGPLQFDIVVAVQSRLIHDVAAQLTRQGGNQERKGNRPPRQLHHTLSHGFGMDGGFVRTSIGPLDAA